MVLAIMSRLNKETRIHLQPTIQAGLLSSLTSLKCNSQFVDDDGKDLKVNYSTCFGALKHIGTSASRCGQNDVRSTTCKKNFIGSFVAQLALTAHKSDKLENSVYGSEVKPFCLNTRTNSQALKEYRASRKIYDWMRMIRSRKTFLLHMCSVHEIFEYQCYARNSDWPDKYFHSYMTIYGQTVGELRARHYKRIVEEDVDDFKLKEPIVPDLREFLFSKVERLRRLLLRKRRSNLSSIRWCGLSSWNVIESSKNRASMEIRKNLAEKEAYAKD